MDGQGGGHARASHTRCSALVDPRTSYTACLHHAAHPNLFTGEPEAATLIACLTDALVHLHSLRIVHRVCGKRQHGSDGASTQHH